MSFWSSRTTAFAFSFSSAGIFRAERLTSWDCEGVDNRKRNNTNICMALRIFIEVGLSKNIKFLEIINKTTLYFSCPSK